MISLWLLKQDFMRRIFGKQEINIMHKQLYKMPLTQSEKNRLSRDIRPKMQAIQQLAQLTKEDYQLKRNNGFKETIQEIITIIQSTKQAKHIHKITLFGSFAKGDMHTFSDIDICVHFHKKISDKEVFYFRRNVLALSPERSDIQVFHRLPKKIQIEIEKDEKTLWINEEYLEK